MICYASDCSGRTRNKGIHCENIVSVPWRCSYVLRFIGILLANPTNKGSFLFFGQQPQEAQEPDGPTAQSSQAAETAFLHLHLHEFCFWLPASTKPQCWVCWTMVELRETERCFSGDFAIGFPWHVMKTLGCDLKATSQHEPLLRSWSPCLQLHMRAPKDDKRCTLRKRVKICQDKTNKEHVLSKYNHA